LLGRRAQRLGLGDLRVDDNFWVDDEPWNKTKAELCREHGIDFHIDDSPHYGKYFSTPYMQVNIKK
jgi:hypothetical protein